MVLKELPEFAVKQNCKISLGESMCKQFKEGKLCSCKKCVNFYATWCVEIHTICIIKEYIAVFKRATNVPDSFLVIINMFKNLSINSFKWSKLIYFLKTSFIILHIEKSHGFMSRDLGGQSKNSRLWDHPTKCSI